MAKAEVLCIGTELLLGDVLDTNSQFLAQQLALLGLNCFYRVTVGDNPERIRGCIAEALRRSDILITSGGLGPTADDLTTECIAAVFDAPLELDQSVLTFIEGLFATRGLKMPPSNAKQALRPRGADILPNPVGSAPGMIWRLDAAQLPDLLAPLAGWSLDPAATAISRHLEFADFGEAFAFMTRVALAAERRDHHPDWSNAYNVVEVTLTTHDAGGLTMKDIEMARLIDRAAAGAG